MLRPPEMSLRSLREHGLAEDVIDVACAMTSCILEAADDVAADTRDESFDDPTSRGGLLYRRAHNRTLVALAADDRATLDTTDNALHVRVGSTAISFYSARNGLDFPSVDGSRTKRRVVDEMQLVLEGVGAPVLRRVVLMHESDEDGLVRGALGVLQTSHSWAWRVTMFDRYAVDDASADDATRPAYDEMSEPQLLPIERRDTDDHGENDDIAEPELPPIEPRREEDLGPGNR